jgi:hypothetical protein
VLPFLCSAGNNETDAARAGAQQWLTTQHTKGFLENRGQITDMDGKPVPFVLFRTEAPGLIVWLTEKGLVIETLKTEDEEAEHDERSAESNERRMRMRKDEKRITHWERIDVELRGATIKKSSIVKEHAAQGHTNYFYGHCPDGIHDVKEYETVTIRDAYPGIDWQLYRKADGALK